MSSRSAFDSRSSSHKNKDIKRDHNKGCQSDGGKTQQLFSFNWVEMKFYQRGQETSFNGMPSLGLRTNSALALGGPCLATS
jgi:hypothetical protein